MRGALRWLGFTILISSALLIEPGCMTSRSSTELAFQGDGASGTEGPDMVVDRDSSDEADGEADEPSSAEHTQGDDNPLTDDGHFSPDDSELPQVTLCSSESLDACDEGLLCVQTQPPYCSTDFLGHCTAVPVDCDPPAGKRVCSCDRSRDWASECDARRSGYGGVLTDCLE